MNRSRQARWMLFLAIAVCVAGVLLVGAFALSRSGRSIGAAPTPSATVPTETGSPAPTFSASASATGEPTGRPGVSPSSDRDRLRAFVEQCPKPNSWRAGQVVYPASLKAKVGQSITYGAAVDVRESPPPPSSVITDPSPAAEPVEVQCVVAARLVALGSGIAVEAVNASDDGGWRRQRFTPQGVIEWSWSVTLREPRPQQLRLELRPAVELKDSTGGAVFGVNEAAYVTVVAVEATWIERLSDWFSTQWPLFVGVAAILGGAVAGVLLFVKQTREGISQLRGPRRRASTKPPAQRTK